MSLVVQYARKLHGIRETAAQSARCQTCQRRSGHIVGAQAEKILHGCLGEGHVGGGIGEADGQAEDEAGGIGVTDGGCGT